MEFRFPVIELVDRYAIAQVKFEKTNGENFLELEFYQKQINQLNLDLIGNDLEELKQLHFKIWALEDDFKKNRIDVENLEEVGKKALIIRDYNNIRVEYKNKIAEKLGDPVREIKR